MSLESTRQSNDSGTEDMPEDATLEGTTQPWVSCLAIVACIGIFLGLAVQNDYESWETLSKFGYLPANSIWNGGYWALITSTFVHFALWHVAFNVYWLWVLGSRLERAVGSFSFLGFFIVSAFVSSSFQLAVSDSTGNRYTQIIRIDPGNAWAYLNRSYLHRALGQNRQAQADLQKARDLDPSIEASE